MKQLRLVLIVGFVLILGYGSVSQATVIQWEISAQGNGHYYEVVNTQMFWTDANSAAEGSTYFGQPGYLATITSQAEQDFIIDNVISAPTSYWLGGYQDRSAPDYGEPSDGWQWITGESWQYTNWASNQPDNDLNEEDYLQIYSEEYPYWNDIQNTANCPYIVEYAPEPATIVLFALGGLFLRRRK